MMGDSLQDQLKALGLAKQKPRPPRKKARKKAVQKKIIIMKAPNSANADMSLDRAYRLRNKEEKQSAHQKKEQKWLQDLERRRVNKQIHELVKAHTLNDKKADLKRNFLYKGRIRSVLCTPEQLKALNDGELGLVFLRGSYVLMLPDHVELVRAISEDHIPDLRGSELDQEGEDEGDEFKVPDDLTW